MYLSAKYVSHVHAHNCHFITPSLMYSCPMQTIYCKKKTIEAAKQQRSLLGCHAVVCLTMALNKRHYFGTFRMGQTE